MNRKIGVTSIWFPILLAMALASCGTEQVDTFDNGRAAPAFLGGKADLPSWLVDSGKSLSCTSSTRGAFSGYDSAHLYTIAAPSVDTDYTLSFSGRHSASAGSALAVFEGSEGKLIKNEQLKYGTTVSVSFTGKADKKYRVGVFSLQWQATGSYELRLTCKARGSSSTGTSTGSGSTKKPASGFKVAAVQYGSGQAASASSACASSSTPNICALSALTARAASNGAKLVVLPEYALGGDQKYYVTAPTVGVTPSISDGLLATFGALARKHGVYLTFDLQTVVSGKYYNTVVAFDPAGKVVAVHHKFNLFGSETKRLTAGKSVTTFDTPAGKVGMLICADIYGSSTLLSRLVKDLGARIVAISSYWTVSGSTGWYKRYTAKYGVYAVVGNTTHSPGQGGGVYDPKGRAMAETTSTSPSVVYAVIP